MEGSELSTAQLPVLVKEWISTEDELRTLSAAVREKRKRAKTLRDMITKIMRGNQVGRLNISAGQVTTKTKATKAPLTKKFIVAKLTDFFNGDAAMAEKCAAFLDQHREMRETTSLALDPL